MNGATSIDWPLHRLELDTRGAVLVEFAILAPVLILVLGGIFSGANYLQANMVIHTYAREAARGVSVGYMTVDDAKSFAERSASHDLNVTVAATIDPATKGDPLDEDVQVTLTISPTDIPGSRRSRIS
ncbi:TadE family protein [Sphingomonas sp. T9W2]|uniref:TadE/TadG family type IV pilus assembly protein n=1 Tax=Sphingomonas sp. T9W2 TaxID=3143183 RepID=UPI0031F509DE